MLHATFANGKSSQFRRYQGYRETPGFREHEEDEITSIVLGPLDFLEAPAVLEFWRAVFARADQAALFPPIEPERVVVRLWPSRRASVRGVRIEPDAQFDFHWVEAGEERKFTVLVEVKWRAPLSGDDQLERQWTDYLTAQDRLSAVHVFLGLDVAAGEQALRNSPRLWKGKLVLTTWLQVRAVLHQLAGRGSPLGRWARLSDRFLEKVGVRRFLGFAQFGAAHYALAASPDPLFWRPRIAKSSSEIQQNNSIFWR